MRIGQIDFYRPPSKAEQDLMHSRESPGVAFQVFEKCTVSWARNEYGERFGKERQGNDVFDLDKLDFENDRDLSKFDVYCREVYKVMLTASQNWAGSQKGTQRLRTLMFEAELKSKYREWTFCLLQKVVLGKERRQLENKDVKGEHDISPAFLMRFSAGHPEALTKSESECSQVKHITTGEVFPPLENIMGQPDEFEAEREWLLSACPKGKARTFDKGKETFLVRMIVNFLLKENDTAVQQLRSWKCACTAGEAVTRRVISPIEDYSREVVLQKPSLERPSLKGPNERRCYGCGCVGHLRGDPECSAVDKAVWMGAPERFKRKVEEGVQPLFVRGERKDGSNRQKLWNELGRKEAPKLPCRNWLWGKGSCKYAERCQSLQS